MNWEVQVFGGVQPSADIAAVAPIAFGVPEVIVGSGEGPRVPLVYRGVLLETRSPGSVSMYSPKCKLPDGSTPSIHVMENVWHVVFGSASVDIEGVEVREDGVAVWSRWEAVALPPSEEDLAILREAFGE